MKMFELHVGDNVYELATNLRVAYVLQGMNNHKSYLSIFQEIDKLPIEKQLEFLYAAYTVGSGSETILSKNDFINDCLDNLDLSQVMEAIKQVVMGITGQMMNESSPSTLDDSSSKN